MNDNLRMPGELVTQARAELMRRGQARKRASEWLGFSVLGVATALVLGVCWYTVQTEGAAYQMGYAKAASECLASMSTMAGDNALATLRGTNGR